MYVDAIRAAKSVVQDGRSFVRAATRFCTSRGKRSSIPLVAISLHGHLPEVSTRSIKPVLRHPPISSTHQRSYWHLHSRKSPLRTRSCISITQRRSAYVSHQFHIVLYNWLVRSPIILALRLKVISNVSWLWLT